MIRIAGIPGTVSEEIRRLRWHRVPDLPTAPPSSKVYEAYPPDGRLRAIVTHDNVFGTGPLWHISVSHVDGQGNPDRCPNWDELKFAVYQLVPDNVPMLLIFPRKTDPYVDDHPTTLHLWEATDKDIGAR